DGFERGLRQGELDDERRAYPWLALHPQGASHAFHQKLRKSQAEPGAFDGALLGAKTLERAEELRHLLLGYALAGIGDEDEDPVRADGLEGDGDRSVLPVVLDRVR